MDQTPLTLPSRSNLLLTANYFQKLGLRYVLFSDRGVLQGLLTKKDVWYVLNGAEETRKTMGADGMNMTTGITREDGEGEERGLLNADGESVDTTPISPGNE
jgi:chloride channel 3/4/5